MHLHRIILAIGFLVLAVGCGWRPLDHDGSRPFEAVARPESGTYYQEDGTFDPAAAKAAYFQLFHAFGYPVSKRLRTDEFWVCDFVDRDFARLGMGGIFWVNESSTYGDAGTKAYEGDFAEVRYGYLGHEIFLLPGQMLPEHRHVGGPEGHGPKMEAWHVRHGTVRFFGEHRGDQGERPIEDLPASERPVGYGEPWFKAKFYAERRAGQLYRLADPESWHFQQAQGDGAIVTEYATYHNQVEFSKPGMAFECSRARGE